MQMGLLPICSLIKCKNVGQDVIGLSADGKAPDQTVLMCLSGATLPTYGIRTLFAHIFFLTNHHLHKM